MFELVFAKEDFNTLLDYHWWDHAIKLVLDTDLNITT